VARERPSDPGPCPECGASLYYDPLVSGGEGVTGGYFIRCSAEDLDNMRAHYAALHWSKEYVADAITENWSLFGPEAVFRNGWPKESI
jgi:hypothetical protein